MKNKKHITTKNILLVVAFFCFVIVLISCSKDPAIPVYGDYPSEVGKIIANKCATAGCHNNASYKAAANLNLTSFATLFQGSSNGSPIIPYRSDFSSLCYFINTYSELGPINSPSMPLNADVLSKNEVQLIKNWIDNGAPDINGKIMWADNPNRKKYYVLNQGCDVVTVFDAETQLPMRYITVGNQSTPELPHMIKLSPDGQYWYVVFVANNILQKFRTSDDKLVGQVTLGVSQNWNTLTISNDGSKGYCMAWPNGSIAVVNLNQMSVIHYYNNSFPNGHGTALNPTNDTLYVTSQNGNFIYKTDTSVSNPPLTVIIDVPGTPLISTVGTLDPHEIVFSPDGSKYFVSCQASNQVRVMRTAGDSLLQIITTGQYPLEFAKSISKNKLYVSCQDEPSSNPNTRGCVTVIDMTTYQAINYSIGYQLHGIAIDETNDYLIVASRNLLTTGPLPHHTGVCGRNGFVNYFKLSTMELLSKKTEVASDPYSVGVKP
jgi:DNA-binding beta-propeller fold protein YncE